MDGLSKKERIKLKKQEKQEERAKIVKKNQVRKYLTRVMIVIAILAVGYFVYATQFDYSGQGILQPVKAYHDFGSVSAKSGIVSTEIQLINTGEGDLTINSLDTSCGCTSAIIINNEIESPQFGMKGHGFTPTNWQTIIPSGEEATLKIFYNPKTHPDLRGKVTRMVNIYTDDPSNKVHEIRIGVNQID